MNIEIRNAEFVNKGSELMLNAILEAVRDKFHEARCVMMPSLTHRPFSKITAKAMYLKPLPIYKMGIHWSDFAKFIPRRILNCYGIVLDKELDVVLDASGFAYGDQFGIKPCEHMAVACKRWKANGTKVILLPQAFGPFGTKRSKKLVREIVENADLIYARDPISYCHLTDIAGKQEKIKISCDFTNLTNGIVPNFFDPEKMKVCIVPNQKMLVSVCKKESKAYVPFMAECIRYLADTGLNPFLLVHEQKDDGNLVEQIQKSSGYIIPIINEIDPLKIKGILSTCYFSIGSRFHSLVSALSQGVPCLGTGWSHKYQMLFEDYDFKEGLVSVSESIDRIPNLLEKYINEKSNSALRKKLLLQSTALKEQTKRMWDEIFRLITR